MGMILGVKVTKLNAYTDDRGRVMQMMRSTDKEFKQFGEIYFSEVLPGKIKGWNKRKKATRHYAVIEGNIQLVLHDGIQTQEFEIGEANYVMVTIPPGVWASFTPKGNKKAIVADLTDLPFDPKDGEKADPAALTDYWKTV